MYFAEAIEWKKDIYEELRFSWSFFIKLKIVEMKNILYHISYKQEREVRWTAGQMKILLNRVLQFEVY